MDQPGSDNAPLPLSTSGRKGKLVVIISVVVAVVIVGATFGTYSVVSHKNGTKYHVGNASAAQVDNLSNNNLSKKYDNTTSPGNSTEVALDAVIFNETTSSSITGMILIYSVEFYSTSEATDDYNSAYTAIMKNTSAYNGNVTKKNGTYGGFNYFTGSFESTYGTAAYIFFAAGHADQFAFVIFDYFVALTNSTALVQDETNAMS